MRCRVVGWWVRWVLVAAVASPCAAQSPCAAAIAHENVCGSANGYASRWMSDHGLTAFTVIQDVRTGAVIVSVASQARALDIATPVMPLSVAKLYLAAAWLEQHPSSTLPADVRNALVHSNDAAGRRLALALRKEPGADDAARQVSRFACGTERPDCYVRVSGDMPEPRWADVLSIGEQGVRVTGLDVSRFLQAVGNGGVVVDRQSTSHAVVSNSMFSGETARAIQGAMRDAVQQGTASSIAHVLDGTGWSIGGKTGTGPKVIGPRSDGWFAGLVFDPAGQPRFTVATFVRRGGKGGGNAARLSAEVARYVIGSGV